MTFPARRPPVLCWLALWLATVLVACGGTEVATVGPPSGSASSGAEQGPPPSPPKAWAEMTFDERQGWMGSEVLPRIGPMFEAYDPERFAGFSCDGCHGIDMQERSFLMPNTNIMELHPTGTPEQRQMVDEHPEMVRFMFNQVLPTMQVLMGAEPYNESTGTGFSCYACHPAAGN